MINLLLLNILGLYGVTAAYAFGGPDCDTLVTAVSTLPPALKLAGKFGISYAFTYHVFNGIRHLVQISIYKFIKRIYFFFFSNLFR